MKVSTNHSSMHRGNAESLCSKASKGLCMYTTKLLVRGCSNYKLQLLAMYTSAGVEADAHTSGGDCQHRRTRIYRQYLD